MDDIGFDVPVVVIWIVTTLAAALATGVAPALRAGRVDLADALRGADRSAADGYRGAAARRIRDTLLVSRQRSP
jgi:hypothetical protein